MPLITPPSETPHHVIRFVEPERRINHEPCRDRGKVLVHRKNIPCCSIVVGPLTLLCIVLVAIGEPLTHAQQDTGAEHIPLALERIVKNLEERARGCTHALHQFEGTRVYRLQYRGLFGDRDAEMVVSGFENKGRCPNWNSSAFFGSDRHQGFSRKEILR